MVGPISTLVDRLLLLELLEDTYLSLTVEKFKETSLNGFEASMPKEEGGLYPMQAVGCTLPFTVVFCLWKRKAHNTYRARSTQPSLVRFGKGSLSVSQATSHGRARPTIDDRGVLVES
ncbi:hypothetical protein M9H77_03134 [Catharanthus roseus]|uniref:Uncharacterized protein n=1 Tax=Catharanthus roseus TaxID=4058 RepID=A0ACC0CAE5_CATRO|nr:hypothetical protein M9H77_03134 [Catharanthus roseus]